MHFFTGKVAIVHEWLVDYSGSEKVLEQLLKIFPQAELFAVVDFLPDDLRWYIQHKPVQTTFIQRLPFARKNYRNWLPLMPMAIEQLDVSGYDLVISNSHAVSKGVITNSEQLHICYCHSPIRYAWDLYHTYLGESGFGRAKSVLAKAVLHYMRQWDLSTINRIDHFLCNSEYIARRIAKTYRREATVIYPPVDTNGFKGELPKEDFYFTASRMVPYKRLDLIVQAFRHLPGKRLVVIGSGPDFEKIKALAPGNVELMGFQPKQVLVNHMQRAKAFIFAADEDFGIIPVEAQAAGTPVIAYKKGGALETVAEGSTGVFFEQQTPEAIARAIGLFEQKAAGFNPGHIRAHAQQFSESIFRERVTTFIQNTLS